MSGYRRTWLRCDHRDDPAEGQRYGHVCGKEFDAPPDLGLPPMGVTRKEAAKAGWAYERSHLGRAFDKDFCPDHKPQEDTGG